MRSLAILGFLLVSPAVAQEERGGVLDEYFACLVGQGAVEIFHGGSAEEAWVLGLAACQDAQMGVENHPSYDDASAHARVVDVGSFAMRALEQLAE